MERKKLIRFKNITLIDMSEYGLRHKQDIINLIMELIV